MSNEARPISPTRFAAALQDLPVANLYSKAFEIRNSIAHLQRSNEELQAYSDGQIGGDRDCLNAIHENEVVIGRICERVALVRSEVERRGGRWHEGDVTTGLKQNGHLEDNTHNGRVREDGSSERTTATAQVSQEAPNRSLGPGGRIDDEELRREMMERMADDEDEGMHL